MIVFKKRNAQWATDGVPKEFPKDFPKEFWKEFLKIS